ncbi:MAG: UDP-3-O-(3-hydroxymyristoyl)glucosamine N-acyltransferase [Fibrobacterota bacterium]
MLLKELAEISGCELAGSPGLEIKGVAPLQEAGPDEIAFLSNPRYASLAASSSAGCIITSVRKGMPEGRSLLLSDNPYLAFARIAAALNPPAYEVEKGVHKLAFVADSSAVHKEACVGPFVYIGPGSVIGEGAVLYPGVVVEEGTSVGAGCVLYSNSVIRRDCVIGNRVIVHPGAVIGADGFGFAPSSEGIYFKIPQTGNVVLEDDVEIGANTTIDRAAMGSTLVKKGSKIDNLVMIAHNVEVGENCAFAAQTGISGSTVVGDSVMMGGQTGVAGHLKIGERAKAAAQAGITRNVKPGVTVSGTPARDYYSQKRVEASSQRLPGLIKRIRELESELQKVKGALETNGKTEDN